MKGTTVDEATATLAVRTVLDALEAAWKRGDGDAFAATCSVDADFINILGMHVRGRPAVSALHAKVFNGPYAGSDVRFSIERVRIVDEDALLAIVPGELQIPAGPARGLVKTVATALLTRAADRWEIASFHNTRREATTPELTAILLDVQAR